jgi:hypothetical protein
VQLLHSHLAFQDLKKDLPAGAKRRKSKLVVQLQRGRFRGIARNLRDSQVYPDKFCRAVAAIQKKIV